MKILQATFFFQSSQEIFDLIGIQMKIMKLKFIKGVFILIDMSSIWYVFLRQRTENVNIWMFQL